MNGVNGNARNGDDVKLHSIQKYGTIHLVSYFFIIMGDFLEIIADHIKWFNTERLSQMVDSIERTSDGLYKDALDNLRGKLKTAKTDDEKFLVVKQIHKLTQLHSEYLKMKENWITSVTKKRLWKVFDDVSMLVKSWETYKISELRSELELIWKLNSWSENIIEWKIKIPEEVEKVKKEKGPKEKILARWNYMSEIPKLLDTWKSEKIIQIILSKLEWQEVNSNWTKVVFTKEYIDRNSAKLIDNFKSFIAFLIDVESNGNPYISNYEWSSAKWLGQRLVWNWRELKSKDWKKIWLTSSYETSLNNVIAKYWNNEIVRKILPFLPERPIREKSNLSPLQLSQEEQLYLLLLDITSSPKKTKTWSDINDFIWLAFLWNSRWMKQIYSIFHHTKPDKKTSDLVHAEFRKYQKDFTHLAMK